MCILFPTFSHFAQPLRSRASASLKPTISLYFYVLWAGAYVLTYFSLSSFFFSRLFFARCLRLFEQLARQPRYMKRSTRLYNARLTYLSLTESNEHNGRIKATEGAREATTISHFIRKTCVISRNHEKQTLLKSKCQKRRKRWNIVDETLVSAYLFFCTRLKAASLYK